MSCDAYDMNPDSPYYGELACMTPKPDSREDIERRFLNKTTKWELFDELEFWKSTAIEHGAPEDAYEDCLADVERMFEEIDPYNTGEIHG
jgi:hypothetical protein